VFPRAIVYFATATIAMMASYAKRGKPKSGVMSRLPTAYSACSVKRTAVTGHTHARVWMARP